MTQMQLDLAIERGVEGMNRAASHANRKVVGWTEIAKNAAIEVIKRYGVNEEFTIEDVRDVIVDNIPAPPDLRSWGSVTQSLIRDNVIIKTGKFKAAVSSNGSPKPLYRKG